jgi:hypothetical protein
MLHLLQSKVANKKDDAGDVIINLDRVTEFALIKFIEENEPDTYCIGFTFNGKENSREMHDTLESAKESLKKILIKTGLNEADANDTVNTINPHEYMVNDCEHTEAKKAFLKLLAR